MAHSLCMRTVRRTFVLRTALWPSPCCWGSRQTSCLTRQAHTSAAARRMRAGLPLLARHLTRYKVQKWCRLWTQRAKLHKGRHMAAMHFVHLHRMHNCTLSARLMTVWMWMRSCAGRRHCKDLLRMKVVGSVVVPTSSWTDAMAGSAVVGS